MYSWVVNENRVSLTNSNLTNLKRYNWEIAYHRVVDTYMIIFFVLGIVHVRIDDSFVSTYSIHSWPILDQRQCFDVNFAIAVTKDLIWMRSFYFGHDINIPAPRYIIEHEMNSKIKNWHTKCQLGYVSSLDLLIRLHRFIFRYSKYHERINEWINRRRFINLICYRRYRSYLKYVDIIRVIFSTQISEYIKNVDLWEIEYETRMK